jgi:hypothetical protein
VELIRFFYGGGTTNEVFEEYITELLRTLCQIYKDKKIVVIMDNLLAKNYLNE